MQIIDDDDDDDNEMKLSKQCWFLWSPKIRQFHNRLDRRRTRHHSTYPVELCRVRSVPGRGCSRSHRQPEMCVQHAGVQIRCRAISDHWLRKLMRTGGLHQP